MSSTPTKRGAPDGSGDDNRPSKRIPPSSPEEGEVDDDAPRPSGSASVGNDARDPSSSTPRRLSPAPRLAEPSTTGRFAFPFKRKDAGGAGFGTGNDGGKHDGAQEALMPGKMSYDRPPGFEPTSSPPRPARGRNGAGAGAGGRRHDPRGLRQYAPHNRAPGGYTGNGHDDRHYVPSQAPSGIRPPRDTRGPWLPPSRDRPVDWRDSRDVREHWHGRDSPRDSDKGKERAQGITRSPTRSPSRSGSPRSTASPSSTRKEKHRLPERRSPVAYSPSSNQNHRGSWQDRGHASYAPSYDARDPNWDPHRRGQYRREGDYYRRGYDDTSWGYDNQFENPRDSFSLNHRRGEGGDYYRSRSPYQARSPRGDDHYRPVSPRRDDVRQTRSPYRPVSPGEEPSAPRPPPPVSMAPRRSPELEEGAIAPSPLPLERRKDETLPPEHAAVSIPIKLPRRHSLSTEDESSAPDVAAKAQPNSDAGSTSQCNPEALPSLKKKKRDPVHRTREEEKEAYGRTFTGCGKREDYELATKLGEGTFGEVHKALQKATGSMMALKRILMHNEKDGMPVTALREIKILKAMNHPCVINLVDMFVVRSTQDSPMSVYMVFPYMDHDLAGLLENERVQLSPSHIKLYMKQLLEGTEYMHRNHIIHRDMKAANLLIANDGSLKIADFGLARAYDPAIVNHPQDFRGRERKYTNCVVTRWYRPPELLLGARQYGGEVDLWGIGCVLAEMFVRKPILPGSSDLDQVERIYSLCGTPNQHTWPNHDRLPGCEGVTRFAPHVRQLRMVYQHFEPDTLDLLDKLLVCNPRERLTASQALDHDYFWTDPLPAALSSLPVWEASHELDKRSRRHHGPPPGPPLLPNNRPHGGPGGPPQVVQPPSMPPSQLPTLRFTSNAPPPREIFRSGGYRGGPPPPGGMPPGRYGGPPPPPPGYAGPGGAFPMPPPFQSGPGYPPGPPPHGYPPRPGGPPSSMPPPAGRPFR